jgi:hypothetical protein
MSFPIQIFKDKKEIKQVVISIIIIKSIIKSIKHKNNSIYINQTVPKLKLYYFACELLQLGHTQPRDTNY